MKNAADESNTELAAHLNRNEAVWAQWITHGVKSDTTLKVDFHFDADQKSAADALERALLDEGLTVVVSEMRGVASSWNVEASETGKWTLGRLQLRTREFHAAALAHGLTFGGLGAQMR